LSNFYGLRLFGPGSSKNDEFRLQTQGGLPRPGSVGTENTFMVGKEVIQPLIFSNEELVIQ
jgi:hypothetical protein